MTDQSNSFPQNALESREERITRLRAELQEKNAIGDQAGQLYEKNIAISLDAKDLKENFPLLLSYGDSQTNRQSWLYYFLHLIFFTNDAKNRSVETFIRMLPSFLISPSTCLADFNLFVKKDADFMSLVSVPTGPPSYSASFTWTDQSERQVHNGERLPLENKEYWIPSFLLTNGALNEVTARLLLSYLIRMVDKNEDFVIKKISQMPEVLARIHTDFNCPQIPSDRFININFLRSMKSMINQNYDLSAIVGYICFFSRCYKDFVFEQSRLIIMIGFGKPLEYYAMLGPGLMHRYLEHTSISFSSFMKKVYESSFHEEYCELIDFYSQSVYKREDYREGLPAAKFMDGLVFGPYTKLLFNNSYTKLSRSNLPFYTTLFGELLTAKESNLPDGYNFNKIQTKTPLSADAHRWIKSVVPEIDPCPEFNVSESAAITAETAPESVFGKYLRKRQGIRPQTGLDTRATDRGVRDQMDEWINRRQH